MMPLRSITCVLFACAIRTFAVAQSPEDPKFHLSLLRVLERDTIDHNDPTAVFAVTPINMEDFPPVLSMGLGYGVNTDQIEHRIDLQNQNPQIARLTIYGKDLPTKAPRLYRLIKDHVQLDAYEDILFLVIDFRNISATAVKTLTLQYGLWEKQDQSVRHEQLFHAVVGE